MGILLLVALASFGFSGSDAASVQFKTRDVLVSDRDGVPLFRGNRDFVLRIGHNPAGQIVAYDPNTGRFRVSTIGTELWVDCAELEPAATACSAASSTRSRSTATRGVNEPDVPSLPLPDIPTCPGDPRCPG
jgi:hypothetical protein